MAMERRPGEQFHPEVFTTARSLSLAGYSSRRIERMLQEQFPGESTPTQRAIVQWRSQEFSQEELEAANQAHLEIVRRTQSMILDDLEPDSPRPRPSTVALATIGGISMDKLLKQSEAAKPHTDQRLVFVFNGNPQIIAPDPN